jgi:hypothetical protein
MEAFRDMQFGVRSYWGLYSVWELQQESWPFLKMSNERRQERNISSLLENGTRRTSRRCSHEFSLRFQDYL